MTTAFRVVMIIVIAAYLLGARRRRAMVRFWGRMRVKYSFPRWYGHMIATSAAALAGVMIVYVLIPQRFVIQQIRSGQILRSGDGTDITVNVPRFQSPYNMSMRTFTSAIVRTMREHEEQAPEIYKVALRERPAAYYALLEAGVRAMPEYTFVFAAESIGAIAETRFYRTGYIDPERDALADRAADVRKRAVAQLISMMEHDENFMAEHGITKSNFPRIVSMVNGAAGEATQGALQGKIADGRSIDINFSLFRRNLLDNGDFEKDSDGDGLADGWKVYPPPLPQGLTLALDATNVRDGQHSQRFTISKNGTYERMITRDVHVTPGATYHFSVWTYVDTKYKFSIRIGNAPGDATYFWTPGIDTADQWLNWTGTFVPKKDEITIFINLNQFGPAPHDFSLWVDSMRLEKESDPALPLAETLKRSDWAPAGFYSVTYGAKPTDSQFFLIRRKDWKPRTL